MMNMKNEVKFTLGVDEEMHKKLSAISEEEQRSLNSQIIYLIKKYIDEYEKNVQKSRTF